MTPLVGEQALTKITLEMLQVYARDSLPEYVYRNMSVMQVRDRVMDNLVFTLTSHVLGHRIEEDQHPVTMTFEWEEWESWWQWCKAIHFPTFSRWLKREPRKVGKSQTRTRYVDVKKYLTFPHATMQYPKEMGKPVVQVTVGSNAHRTY